MDCRGFLVKKSHSLFEGEHASVSPSIRGVSLPSQCDIGGHFLEKSLRSIRQTTIVPALFVSSTTANSAYFGIFPYFGLTRAITHGSLRGM